MPSALNLENFIKKVARWLMRQYMHFDDLRRLNEDREIRIV